MLQRRTRALQLTTKRTVEVSLTHLDGHVTISLGQHRLVTSRDALLASLHRPHGALVMSIGTDRLLVQFDGPVYEAVVLQLVDVARFLDETLTEQPVTVPDVEFFV